MNTEGMEDLFGFLSDEKKYDIPMSAKFQLFMEFLAFMESRAKNTPQYDFTKFNFNAEVTPKPSTNLFNGMPIFKEETSQFTLLDFTPHSPDAIEIDKTPVIPKERTKVTIRLDSRHPHHDGFLDVGPFTAMSEASAARLLGIAPSTLSYAKLIFES